MKKLRIASIGNPEPAPLALNPSQVKIWNKYQKKLNNPIRDNDGSFIIIDDDGPIASVTFKGKAKRGQAYCTDDPEGLANAQFIVDACNKAIEEKPKS